MTGRSAMSIFVKINLMSTLRAFCLGGGWSRKAPRMPPQVRDIIFPCPGCLFLGLRATYSHALWRFYNNPPLPYGQPHQCHLFPCWNNLLIKPFQGPYTPRRTARNDETVSGRGRSGPDVEGDRFPPQRENGLKKRASVKNMTALSIGI
jgi:hypothetical protein